MKHFPILACLLFTLCQSCGERELLTSFYGSWEVKKIELQSATVRADGKLLLSVSEHNIIELKLEENTCHGDIFFASQDEVIISLQLCTEACCDSEFSNLLKEALNDDFKLVFEKRKLFLQNDQLSIKLTPS